jgi:CHAD domain-containing protein
MAKAPDRQAKGTVGELLRAVGRGILADARAALEDGERADSVAIHDLRKALKRWRALLRLLEPALGAGGTKLRHEARDVARELNPARDAQAALDALDDALKRAPDFDPASAQSIRERIEDLRKEAEDVALAEEMRVRMKDYLNRASRAAGRWPVQRIETSAVAAQLTKTYRRARRRLPGNWRKADGEDLHEFRRRVIECRHQLELAGPLWPSLRKGEADAQRVRERLGSYQDLLLLASLTAPERPLAPWRSHLGPVIARRQALHLKHAERIGRKLFAGRAKAFRQRLRDPGKKGT